MKLNLHELPFIVYMRNVKEGRKMYRKHRIFNEFATARSSEYWTALKKLKKLDEMEDNMLINCITGHLIDEYFLKYVMKNKKNSNIYIKIPKKILYFILYKFLNYDVEININEFCKQ